MKCKICAGKMAGKALERKTDGCVSFHHRGNLRRHLEKHGMVFKKNGGASADQQQQQQQQNQASRVDATQSKITHFTSFTAQQAEELTQAIVLMCALDNRPFSIVEGRGFRLLLDKATGRRYVIPSRWTIARKCTSMAEQARAATRAVINVDTDDGATFTASFDAWKDRCVGGSVGVCGG